MSEGGRGWVEPQGQRQSRSLARVTLGYGYCNGYSYGLLRLAFLGFDFVYGFSFGFGFGFDFSFSYFFDNVNINVDGFTLCAAFWPETCKMFANVSIFLFSIVSYFLWLFVACSLVAWPLGRLAAGQKSNILKRTSCFLNFLSVLSLFPISSLGVISKFPLSCV